MKKVIAFTIHILTSSGGAFALLALLAAVQKDWTMLFAWLLVAQFVDGIDGPIARHFHVRETLPNWSGDALDYVIDFITYVFLPAFVFVHAELIPGMIGTLAAAIIVMSGGLYYADSRMKTTSKAFRGFPAVWNGVLFYYFIFTPDPAIGFSLICLLALAQFIPIEFIHPVRVMRLRWATMAMVALWTIFAVKVTLNGMISDQIDQWVLGLSGAYFFVIGGLLQLLRGKEEA
ncbi:MAG: phosphatidylcholine/phosphatidylserine synthase [Cohaesibacter sp.]|nr:phosphatidylcholine/phosphatidylserine synthase [Cohaesibacter sp.]MCV6600030.1 phosphatidylcholine/phosphatidylserine synthase [Cohaesibacter sp.]